MKNKNQSLKSKFSAFTIVELLIVIVIIGILAAITIVSYTGITKKANESTVQAELSNAKKQISLYYVEHGVYPTGLETGTNCLTGTTNPNPDTKYCLKSSGGSTFTLTDATGSDYTLTLTKGTDIAYKVTKDTGPTSTTAVAVADSFVKTWGGSGVDTAVDLTKTNDGGFIAIGQTLSFGAGGADVYISKFDSNGNVVWNKTWGGTGADVGMGIVQTNDGGYAATGQTSSFGAGVSDAFILKFDSNGNVVWSKTWGGTGDENGRRIIQTSDNGYAVIGTTISFGAGNSEVFLNRYDSSGVLVWNKTWGGTGIDSDYDIIQLTDGSYVTTGITSLGAGGWDMFLTKFDSIGSLLWNKTLGGIDTDYGVDLIKTNDGGYAVTGILSGFGASSYGMLFAKYDSAGNLTWNRVWDGVGVDIGTNLLQASDSGYVITGETDSFGAGARDIILVKYDVGGNLIWNKTWGGVGNDSSSYGLSQTSDSGYIMTGSTVSYGSGVNDAFLIKTNSSGVINNCYSPMCQTPTATITTPSVTITTPSATITTPTATVTTPTATVTTPSTTVTTVVAP